MYKFKELQIDPHCLYDQYCSDWTSLRLQRWSRQPAVFHVLHMVLLTAILWPKYLRAPNRDL
jgi:hypothetical protein